MFYFLNCLIINFIVHLCLFLSHLELVTVIGSDLFSQDGYIKQYLLDPDLPLITAIKIGLRYYITADLILQLEILKNHLKIKTFAQIYPNINQRL